MHIHVHAQNDEAKFWLEPVVELAQCTGLSRQEINTIRRLIKEHEHDIRSAWNKHFHA